MNTLHIKIFLLLTTALHKDPLAGRLLKKPSKKLIPSSTPKFFSTIVEERQTRLIERKKERAAFKLAIKNLIIPLRKKSISSRIKSLPMSRLYESILKMNFLNKN